MALTTSENLEGAYMHVSRSEVAKKVSDVWEHLKTNLPCTLLIGTNFVSTGTEVAVLQKWAECNFSLFDNGKAWRVSWWFGRFYQFNYINYSHLYIKHWLSYHLIKIHVAQLKH